MWIVLSLENGPADWRECVNRRVRVRVSETYTVARYTRPVCCGAVLGCTGGKVDSVCKV